MCANHGPQRREEIEKPPGPTSREVVAIDSLDLARADRSSRTTPGGYGPVAAQRLGRRWIGIDITHLAINLMRTRLLHTLRRHSPV
jgi:hypothetical protein